MSNPGCAKSSPAAGLSIAALAALLLTIAAFVSPAPAVANPKYASIVVDQNTGRVLYARNADARRYPASLTKIMTLYMVFEQLEKGALRLNTPIAMTAHAASKPPSKIGLKPGQTFQVEHAIKILCTKSANDIAAAIAEHIGGSESGFARLMTAKARELGMPNTTFRNASGLPDKGQVTTARDMAALARRMQTDFPQYYGYFSTKYFSYRGKKYRNHNGLLFSYKGTDGIKTGYIRASGFNLTASARRGDKHLVAVVMGGKSAKSRNQHVSHLLNKSWKSASSRKRPEPVRRAPLPVRNPLNRDVPVASAKQVQTASLSGAAGITVDGADPAMVMRGSLAGTAPAREAPSQAGGYHVQVGAYSSRGEAVQRLEAVKSEAGGLLEGHTSFTMPVPVKKQHLYRARFAGFSEGAARAACSKLEARKIPCIVMRAE